MSELPSPDVADPRELPLEPEPGHPVLRLGGEVGKQIARVLRLRPGDGVVLLDGRGGSRLASISGIERDAVLVELGGPAPCAPEPPIAVTLFAAILKGDRQDWLVQKAVELGAKRIQPILTERGVARADGAKPERWRRIAREAAEQCERAIVPDVGDPFPLTDISWPGTKAIACTERSGQALSRLLEPSDREIALLIGPEGGWSDGERQRLVEAGALQASLGPRILRAETAAVAALTATMATLAWPLEIPALPRSSGL